MAHVVTAADRGGQDFAAVGVTNLIVGENLCEAAELRAGERVLDVATGMGNTALAAARRWCEVTAIDWTPALLERGRERAAAEGLRVEFCEGEPEDIPFDEGSFDVVLSTFGCMFAPGQEKAARELLRVCRRGGRIGLTAWAPEGLTGQLFELAERYVPVPPGLCSPIAWGREERIRELFGYGVSAMRFKKRHFVYRYLSEKHGLEFIRSSFGPLQKALETLESEEAERLAGEVATALRRANSSGDETIAAPSEYLEAVLTRSWR